jgi:hypothetical protein
MRFWPKNYLRWGNNYLTRKYREAGDQLRVVVIRDRPNDPADAEQMQILRVCGELANISHNPWRDPLGVEFHPEVYCAPKCELCDAPITVRKSKYCRSCLGALLGYKGGSSKQQLRDLCKQIDQERRAAARA